jgi:hypothetical protein
MAMELWTRLKSKIRPGSSRLERTCSFCGKSQRHVTRMVATSWAAICEHCIVSANAMLAEQHRRDPEFRELPAGAVFDPNEGNAWCSLCHQLFPQSSLLQTASRTFACASCVAELSPGLHRGTGSTVDVTAPGEPD